MTDSVEERFTEETACLTTHKAQILMKLDVISLECNSMLTRGLFTRSVDLSGLVGRN